MIENEDDVLKMSVMAIIIGIAVAGFFGFLNAPALVFVGILLFLGGVFFAVVCIFTKLKQAIEDGKRRGI